MATLPSASVLIDDEAGAFAGNTGYCVVMGCTASGTAATPTVIASAASYLDTFGYSEAAEYVALHLAATKKPVLFVKLATATAGAVGSNDGTGIAGTCVITVTGTPLIAVDAVLTVVNAGTIGTNGITFNLSLDGGVTEKLIRLGTAATYTIPYVGLVLNFGAGTLLAADEYTFVSSAPMWDSAGIAAARAALAAQLKLARSFVVIGDVPTDTVAGYVTTEANAYETTNDRFVYARVNVSDRLPLAKKSKVVGQTLTFGTDETITRSAGSWVADGVKLGDTVVVDGSVSNDGSHIVTTLTPTVLTAFASVFVSEIATASEDVSVTVSKTMAAWVTATATEFAPVDAQKRIDIGLGRLRKLAPISGWSFRLPVAWAASIREYQHDLHIPCWRKQDGPLDGWSALDETGNIVEFDERVNGGGLADRFTCARSYGNGPNGAFIALSMTRATEGSLLSRTHNMAVANLACTVVHAATENAIGAVLQLDSDGHATDQSLSVIEASINTDLEIALLQQGTEGPKASKAVWRASRTDVLNVVGATLTGVLDLHLNGTVEQIATTVKVS
jgi:hypothetical protein